MEDSLTQLIMGGGLVVLVIDRAFGALKNRGVDVNKVVKQIDELHAWHNKEDDDGVKVWYVRKSLEDAIEKLASAINKLSESAQSTHVAQGELSKSMSHFGRELRDIKDAVNK
jgi:deoxyribodipyrimidine photolyase-like uncharacterized protein